MAHGVIIVEGHGEVEAAQNLVTRLGHEVGLYLSWKTPRRYPKLHLQKGVERAAERTRVEPDVAAMLILKDEDDRCPAEWAPRIASWLRDLRLPFPAAVVLLYREYETLFLPCVDLMAGRELDAYGAKRPGLRPGTRFDGDFEAIRGVKEWLSRHFPDGTSYKPTLDQLPMTRMLDFARLRSSGLSCFGSLERALRFLAAHIGEAGCVYPPA
ncbi:MAG TPA: DUF4276 family protein [Nannocystis sp.]